LIYRFIPVVNLRASQFGKFSQPMFMAGIVQNMTNIPSAYEKRVGQ